jgi:AmmeMemoRadiSam system protein B/AmmeMemoRadiSam system protein A
MKIQRLALIIGMILAAEIPLLCQGVRQPVWAGQFYDDDPKILAARIDGFIGKAESKALLAAPIAVIIVPHAGYEYSGQVAAFAYRAVLGKDFETVVILGPSHYVGFDGCSIYPEGGFATPLGVAEVDSSTARALMKTSGFGYLPEAHAKEHSIEVQVPFIQRVLLKAKIVPVVMGVPAERTIKTMANALAKVLADKKALVIASTDMSHFLAKKEANALDKTTISLVENLKTATLIHEEEEGANILCGGAGVASALLYAQQKGAAKVVTLKYGDSSDAGGPEDRVVGYFAAAVTVEPRPSRGSRLASLFAAASTALAPVARPQEEFTLSADEKKELLRIARETVEKFVREGKLLEYAPTDPNFLAERGAFVTLTKHGQLRGCIGFIEPVFPLYVAVLRGALYAASEDPRFSPVTAAELKDLEYEISVLTPLEKISDPRSVQVGKHGLVMAMGGRKGVLLPQVPVENHWDREEFLAQACVKAGLPPDSWKKGAEIYVFEAIVFR